jgi:mono/diheme cytochrome c family protein
MVRADMLGVGLFVAFWLVIGVGLFLLAVRGGVTASRAPDRARSYRTSTSMGLLTVVVYVAFGIALPLVFLVGNHKNANAQVGGVTLNKNQASGRQLFAQKCGFCHTLAASNSVGLVGPNLDALQPPYTLVLNTISHGCVQNPPANSPQTCLGYGTMPAGIIEGQEAQDVASFVARIAGKE